MIECVVLMDLGFQNWYTDKLTQMITTEHITSPRDRFCAVDLL